MMEEFTEDISLNDVVISIISNVYFTKKLMCDFRKW